MSEARQPRTMPLRRWLAVALLLCFLVPVMVTGLLVFHFAGVGDDLTETDDALELLRDEQPRWSDPAWQEQTRARLAEDGVDFVLIEDGQEIFRTTDNPFVDSDGDSQSRLVEQFVAPGTGSPQDPPRTAIVYGEDNSGPPEGIWMAPIVALSALLATLAAIAWLLGRTVVRPLGATSGAARQIATGDLDISLPTSSVREVNEVSSALTLMSDELRKSIEQQAELEQERRMFVGAVAHDLRTPLFSLRGALQGLESGVANTPDKRARYASIASEKADALERLISDLFDYTRLEYLDQTPRQETLDLTALLQREMEGVLPRAEAKEIELEMEAPDDPCAVQGDEHLLSRAIENLLDNALRFTPAGGTVRIGCKPAKDRVTFSVYDSGPGIPDDEMPHLFSPLFRGETSRNRSTGGAGLGLTIARRILRAHGGELTAGNHANGAVFTAVLPQPAGNT